MIPPAASLTFHAQAQLGWAPRVDLATGLDRTIAYFEDLIRKGHLRDYARGAVGPNLDAAE